jgi:aminopeptidase N
VKEFAAAGLKPGGDQGGWFQPFTARGGEDNAVRTLRNIIGILPGSDPKLAGEVALLTAHYDHLGFGWPNARAAAVGKLHPGADDNASGVAVMLELARQMAAAGPQKRSVVFVAFSGEEGGLHGSRHYVQNPIPVPLAGITGVVNLDTVGRLGNAPIQVLATGSAREWPFVFRGITAVTGLQIRDVPGASQSSDQRSFIEAGIPAVQIFTGAHLDYHQPTDTADKVDPAGLVKVAVVAREALAYLADTDKRPAFTPIPGEESGAAATAAPPAPAPRRASLGTIPDFAFQGPGLRLEGVVPGSAADRAGLKAGDVLLRMAGKDIAGLGGYNELLKGLNPGDEVEISWRSDGAERTAKVKLGQR